MSKKFYVIRTSIREYDTREELDADDGTEIGSHVGPTILLDDNEYDDFLYELEETVDGFCGRYELPIVDEIEREMADDE